MRTLFVKAAFVVVCSAVPLAACTADVHGNTINVDVPNLSISTDVDVNNIHPGERVGVTIKADTSASQTPTMPKDASTSAPSGNTSNGSIIFKLFLDDSSTTALAVTASLKVDVTIPMSTPPGPHKLVCRAFHADGTPTDSETSLDIDVTASVTTSGDH